MFIETIIRLCLKNVEDFDESKGVTYGDQMTEVFNKRLMTRVGLEKEGDEVETHIQHLEFHIQSIEVELTEFTCKNEILCLEMQQVINEKQNTENTVKLVDT